jgi:tetratricopeptide (TPR) repeat protein
MPPAKENSVLILGAVPETWNDVRKSLTASFNQLSIEKTSAHDTLPARAKRELPSAIIIFKSEFTGATVNTCLQRLRNTAATATIPTIFVISQPVDMSSMAVASEYDVCGIVSHSCIAETLPQILANAWNASTNSASMRPLLEKLNFAIANNSIDETDKIARELYNKFPQEIAAQMEFANSCIRNGDWSSAKKLVDEAIRKDHKNPRVASTKIRILLKEKKFSEARALLDQIEILSPKNASRLAFMSDIHLSIGDKSAARNCLNEALTISDNNRDARISMAELDISEGMMAEALKVLRETATQDEMASFFNDLGVLAVREGRF